MQSTRDNRYEIVRVVAMLFVIAVHVIGNLPTDTEGRIFCYYVLTLVFYTCNGLFFFLSGKFALGKECNSKKEYLRWYYKKVVNLLLPCLFYMFLRQVYMSQEPVCSTMFWREFFGNILYGYSGTEYWFLYTLVGNLLLAPFLSKAFAGASNYELYLFLFIGFMYNALITYLPYWGYSFAWSYPWGGVVFIFLHGLLLRKGSRYKKKRAYCIAVRNY